MPTKPGVYLDSDLVYHSTQQPVKIPDSLDFASFIFDYTPEFSNDPGVINRPRPENHDMLIDALSGQKLTYQQAKHKTTLYAKAFEQHLGFGWDDTLAIYSPNDINFPLSIWACHRLGGVVSSANPSFSASELAYQLKAVSDYRPLKGLIVHPESLDVGIEAAREAGLSQDKIILIRRPTKNSKSPNLSNFRTLEDLANSLNFTPEPKWQKLNPGQAKTKLAFLSFSSGTTGLPKAVSISHYSMIANVLQLEQHHKGLWEPFKDKALAVLPFYHIYGMSFMGYPLVILPKFNFKDFLENISKYRVNIVFAVPPIIVSMAKSSLVDQYDLKCIKLIMSGAAPITGDIIQELQRKFKYSTFEQGYGLTETCTAVSYTPVNGINKGEAVNLGSAGKLLPNYKIKIVDPVTGKSVGFDQRGEIWVNGPNKALGYLNNKKATQETWDENGYIHTGDEGYMDKEGYLFITDRLKELIKVKGSQVPPAELEGFILGHQYVADVCVIGVPDTYAGELPKAYITLTEVAKKLASSGEEEKIKKEIYNFVSKHKVKYKWLDGGIEFIDSIPKNPSGKLLRKKLRERHAESLNQARAKL